jgi:allantoinase
MSSKIRILSNVFINITGNKFKLSDIFFDEHIVNIIPKMTISVVWDEISTIEKLNAFISKLNLHPLTPSPAIIDGEYLLAIPGGIDPHVHFSTPGRENLEDFEHGTQAAACGGTTTVIDMPFSSFPPVTTLDNLRFKLLHIQQKSLVDFALWGGVDGKDFIENINIQRQIDGLSKAGIAGFKSFLISGSDSYGDLNKMQLQVVADLVSQSKKILALHSEDKELINIRTHLVQKQGRIDWRSYCETRDDKAEGQAIRNVLDVAKRTNCKTLILHVSSEMGTSLIRNAKKEGINISAETCPHYLYFTQNDFDNPAISNYLKTDPPVKKEADRDALWEALIDGTISFVSSGHSGCNPQIEKSSDNFWEVISGIPGTEHRVPFLFSEGFIKGKLTAEQVIHLLITNPADFFGLTHKGKLEFEKDADITLVNPWKSEIVKSDDMHSKGKYTPFEGITFNAVIEKTILRGKVIYDRKNPPEVNIGHGEFLTIF